MGPCVAAREAGTPRQGWVNRSDQLHPDSTWIEYGAAATVMVTRPAIGLRAASIGEFTR